MKLTEKQVQMVTGGICGECGSRPRLTDSGKTLGRMIGKILYCDNCNAWTRAPDGRPVSRLVKKPLREAHFKAETLIEDYKRETGSTDEELRDLISDLLGTPREYSEVRFLNMKSVCHVMTRIKELREGKKWNRSKLESGKK